MKQKEVKCGSEISACTMVAFFIVFKSVMSGDSGMTERTETDELDEGREGPGKTIRGCC